MSLAVAAALALLHADAYYFLVVGGDVDKKCEVMAGVTAEGARDIVVRAADDSWMDFLSFQGRLPGTIGVDAIKRSSVAGETPLAQTTVISDTAEHCRYAQAHFLEVREAIDQTRSLPMAKVKRSKKGRLIFDMSCTQTEAGGTTRTNCVHRKSCRNIKVTSSDARAPLSLVLPCDTTEIMAD